MKVLLTGGAGFIGSHIANVFIQEGHQVVILDDLSSGKKENIPPQASFYHRGITDPSIEKIFEDEKPEAVVHHAAQVSVSASVQNPFHDLDINIRGTVSLLSLAVHSKVKKFIFASTGGAIYGEHDYFPADEQHPLRPLSPYGVGKLSAEKYIYFFHKTYGLPYTILRYSNVYGPRQDPFGEAGVIAIFTLKMLTKQQAFINGSGQQTRDFVFVRDVARANLMSLEGDTIGEINISTGTETTINQLYALLQSATGSQDPPQYGPPLPGEQQRSVLSWEKAKNDLGWQPQIALEKGLEETVRFFQDTRQHNG